MDRAGTRAPVLLAGSFYGGHLAARVSRQRPDLVRGLLRVCPGVRAGPAERDLPTGDRPAAAAGWLSGAPAGLRSHLDRALGQRTPGVVAALSAGGSGDEHYQDALTGGPACLDDQDADFVFAGPVAVVAGRNDRIVGYTDQFRALRHYRDATYSLLDHAGHYLPSERPGAVQDPHLGLAVPLRHLTGPAGIGGGTRRPGARTGGC